MEINTCYPVQATYLKKYVDKCCAWYYINNMIKGFGNNDSIYIKKNGVSIR